MKIGFIGLGNVAGNLSDSLIRNGHDASALDPNTDRLVTQKVNVAQGQRKVRPVLRSFKKFSFDGVVKLFRTQRAWVLRVSPCHLIELIKRVWQLTGNQANSIESLRSLVRFQ